MKKYEYELFIVPPFMTAIEEKIDDETQDAITHNLNKRGAEGFRLIRAEADGQGVMWLVMERIAEAAKPPLHTPLEMYLLVMEELLLLRKDGPLSQDDEGNFAERLNDLRQCVSDEDKARLGHGIQTLIEKCK